MKFRHIQSKEKKILSFIIIPPSNKTKQFSVYRWIPTFIILTIVISLTTFIYKFNKLQIDYSNLKHDFDIKLHNLDVLNTINDKQASELDSLRNKTKEIEEKLSSITELQLTVKEMVGIKTKDDNTNQPQTVDVKYRQLFTDKSSDKLELEMDMLSEVLDQTQTELNTLIENVDDRLKYLEAKPNLVPTNGRITSKYGWRRNPFGKGKEFHYGLDIANNYNTKIKAAGKGIVTYAGYSSGFGKIVIISHGYGYETLYGHNNKLYVKIGDKVDKGQLIAAMGNTGRSTGPHVHFEVRYYGKRINPSTILNNNK